MNMKNKNKNSRWSDFMMAGIVLLIIGISVILYLTIRQNMEINNIRDDSDNLLADVGKKGQVKKDDIGGEGNKLMQPTTNPVVTPEPTAEIMEEDLLQQRVNQKLSEITLEEKVAQLFFITPDALSGVDGISTVKETMKTCFSEYPVGGLVFFDKNIISPEQIIGMTGSLKEISMERLGVIPFLGVDEEGGTVLRIADNSAFPVSDVGNMAAIGATGDAKNAYQAGAAIGSYLSEYGFNLDFAPVADVLVNPENAVAKNRSFGGDAVLNGEMVKRAAEGIMSQNVSAVLKHFPGHGATEEDSHEGAATSYRTLEELRSTEFIPFTAGIEAGAEFVLAGHISMPNVTGDNVPATLSYQLLTGILRQELGFDGIIITDAMNMGAITQYYSSGEAAVTAIQAGVDMVLMPYDFKSAYQAVLEAAQSGTISQERIDESVGRILKVKYKKQM